MRLIDADALYDKLNEIGGCDAEPDTWARGWDDAIDEAIKTVEESPDVDAELIRRGAWIFSVHEGMSADYHVHAKCSECGWDWFSKDGAGNYDSVFSAFVMGDSEAAHQFVLAQAKERRMYHYCPNCGAGMFKREEKDHYE